MVTNELKIKIVAAMKERRANFPSDAKFSVFLGVKPAQFSRVINGELDRVLSDANWISIARKLDVNMNETNRLVIAQTEVYKFITAQLNAIQTSSLSSMFCDLAGIGKTVAARDYARKNMNVVYVDCSQVKSRQKLVRFIAKEFGVNFTGRYADVYEDLVYYVRTISTPLIILDEAGDLDYSAVLELKALWNATEGACAWYMIGADGFKAKFESNLARKKIGYAELFRRFGNRYQKITPDGREEMKSFDMQQIAQVAKANGITDVQKIYAKTGGSLTRLAIEITKIKAA